MPSVKNLQSYPVDELRLIYSLLHAQLADHPPLMESELLHDLQTHLQAEARRAGVDVTVHAQWATWLAGGPRLREVK